MSKSKLIYQWRNAVVHVNFSFLARYFKTTKQALAGVKAQPNEFEEFKAFGSEEAYVKGVIDNHNLNHNYAGILLAYANMDELLTHALKTFGSQFGCKLKLNELRGGGINRYKKYIHKACNISEEDIAIDWVLLEDFAVVRNAIIHANGNKSIVSNKKELEAVVARRNPSLKLGSNVKLFVSSEFVELCINAAANTCLAINDYAQNRL